MGDPLSILGFYFTLIGFITGIFFTRLDGWYNDVKAKASLVDPRRTVNRLLDLKDDLTGLTSSEPRVSFIVVGIFLTVLAVLSLFVPASDSPVDPILFLYTPLWVTVCAYWTGGILLLVKAQQLIRDAMAVIKQKTE